MLTATSLLMRVVGLAFQVFLSNKIGAAGIGLFQLIMSVSMFATTFAISGIRFATTRLVSEELGAKNNSGIKKAVSRCLMYALSFGLAASFMLYFGAEFVGTRLIGDSRTVLSLRLLSISLPFLSMGSVLSGYFTAVGRVTRSAIAQILEQVVRIATIVAVLFFMNITDIEKACAAIVIGGIAGEIFSFLIITSFYIYDKRRYPSGKEKGDNITRRMFGIAIPLAASAYARTAINTVQNLLIPKGFRKSGATSEKALADYGMITGMVFPVITFPHAFFASLSEMLVPELTEAQVRGEHKKIESFANRILQLCLLFSIGVMGILFCFSRELGAAIYKTADVGVYIMLLAPLMPLMYMDSVTDGMLRGLGQHLYSMKYNIIDSLLSTVLIWVLLPRYAVLGYIFVLYFSEAFNFTLSIMRLNKITNICIDLCAMAKSIIAIVSAVSVAVLVLRTLGNPLAANAVSLILHILLSVVLYCVFIKIFRVSKGANVLGFLRTGIREEKDTRK